MANKSYKHQTLLYLMIKNCTLLVSYVQWQNSDFFAFGSTGVTFEINNLFNGKFVSHFFF